MSSCIVCGRQIGLLDKKFHYVDGDVCEKCHTNTAIKLGVGTDRFSRYAGGMTFKDIVSSIENEKRESYASQQAYKEFKATHVIAPGVSFNDNTRQMAIATGARHSVPIVLDYSQIISADVIDSNGEQKGMGGAVAGGWLLGGPIGAAALGGIRHIRNKNRAGTCEFLRVDIYVTDCSVEKYSVYFISTPTPRDDHRYQRAVSFADQLMEKIMNITAGLITDASADYAEAPMSPAKAPSASSTGVAKNEEANIQALLKYKELLDMGILTQEEFDAKKKQLLG